MAYKIPNPSDFGISPKYGFLSPDAPLTSFSHQSYHSWDTLIVQLPSLIKNGILHTSISQLPLLSTKHLQTERDYRRAYVVLAFLIHGNVWQHHQLNQANEKVPKQLSEPFLAVCTHLGLPPVVSYAGLCIWNWRLVDSNADMDLDNLYAVATFTGTRGEEAFYHVPVLVEYEGGQLMHVLLGAARAVQKRKENAGEVVVGALKETTAALARMSTQLGKLYGRLDANFFYHEHRPFMAGGKGMEEKGLRRGMVFQYEGKELEGKLVGGSAVQSSLFPFLDIVLGVIHDDGILFQEMRKYMPGEHREFLEQVSRVPSLRQYVQSRGDNAELREEYDTCLQALRSWRGKHIALVSKYIVQPAREAAKAARVDRIEVSNAGEADDEWELQGTGGSALIPFLKQARDDTKGIDG